jgi:hypothetical protein
VERPDDSFRGNGVLIDDQPERPLDVIDAPKRLTITRLVASSQSHTLFHQPTPKYSICVSRSTPSNTETHTKKSNNTSSCQLCHCPAPGRRRAGNSIESEKSRPSDAWAFSVSPAEYASPGGELMISARLMETLVPCVYHIFLCV